MSVVLGVSSLSNVRPDADCLLVALLPFNIYALFSFYLFGPRAVLIVPID